MIYTVLAEDMGEGTFGVRQTLWFPGVGPKTLIKRYALPLETNKMPALRDLAAWLGVSAGRSPKKAALAAAIQKELVFPQ
jgi:hypothetical protein